MRSEVWSVHVGNATKTRTSASTLKRDVILDAHKPWFCCPVFRFYLKEVDKKGGKNTFTCVACHPKDDCIATGHEDGKIRLW